MRNDDQSNPIFWGCAERKDWLLGVDVRDLKAAESPELPPMPPDEAREYGKCGCCD